MESEPATTSTATTTEPIRKPPRLLGGFIAALGLLIALSGVGMLSLGAGPLLLICGVLVAAGGMLTFSGSKVGLWLHLAGIIPMFAISLMGAGITPALLGGLLVHGLLIFYTVRSLHS